MLRGHRSRPPARTRYEELLRAEGTPLATALADGVHRVSAGRIDDTRERALREVAAGAAAPLLVGYVRWVLQHARALQLDRLYFVARDGEVLLDLAQRLRAEGDPELVYLHGSRQSWYPAGVDPDEPRSAVESLGHRSDDSLHSLLGRCGVDPDRWLDHAATDRDVERDTALLAGLLDDPAFLADVTAGLRGRQDRLRAYLVQAGLDTSRPSGVVDIGWYGRSLHHLTRLLTEMGAAIPVGFYLGFIGEEPVRQPVLTWLEGRETELKFLMLETFCAGTHGQVLDFAIDADGRATPVLASARNEPALAWGLGSVREALATVADTVAETSPEVAATVASDDDVRDVAMRSFRAFYVHPTRDEARAWGAFPFEVGPTAARPEVLAERRPLRTIVASRRRADPDGLRWPAGDHALAPLVWRVTLALRRSLRRSLRRPLGRPSGQPQGGRPSEG